MVVRERIQLATTAFGSNEFFHRAPPFLFLLFALLLYTLYRFLRIPANPNEIRSANQCSPGCYRDWSP